MSEQDILDSVRDFPGQYVNRTIAIARIRTRRGLPWHQIGALFGISPTQASRLAQGYSPGDYCAEMVELVPPEPNTAVQCGQPTVRVFDLSINGMDGKMGLCQEHLSELAHRWDGEQSAAGYAASEYVKMLAYSTPWSVEQLSAPVKHALALNIPTVAIEKMLKLGPGFLAEACRVVQHERRD